MKIVIANTDSMVSKLIEACAKKTGLQVQHFISLEEIDASMLEDCFLFVDENALGSDTKRAKQIGTDSLSCLIYSRRKPLNEFKYLVQKPFLPTQVLELIRKELVRRGEDFNRAVEEEKKAPIEPIKDIPLNEFDLKDEHIFEGNLELPPLPDTNEVDTKTSAQSAKEQKEQNEYGAEEENFLEVGEDIAHKSLAAIQREQDGDSSMPSPEAIANAEELVANDINTQEVAEFGSEVGLDSLNSFESAQSAGDIRESLAGDLDDSLESIDSLGSLDNLGTLDNEANNTIDDSLNNAEEISDNSQNLASLNSIKGNLAGLGSNSSDLGLSDFGGENSQDSSTSSEKDELLGGDDFADDLSGDLGNLDLDNADLGENLAGDLDNSNNELAQTMQDLPNATSDDLAQSASQTQDMEQTPSQEIPQNIDESEISTNDSTEMTENIANASTENIKEHTQAQEVSDLGGEISDIGDLADINAPSQAQVTENDLANNAQDSTQEGQSQEMQSPQSQPMFESGVLDKDEAQTIQELLNGDANKADTPDTPTNQTTTQTATSTQSQSATNEVESGEEGDFADLSEGDIMEVLGEEVASENIANTESSEQESSQENLEIKESSGSTTNEATQEPMQESITEITKESQQADSMESIADQANVAQENNADLTQEMQGDLQSDLVEGEPLESLAKPQVQSQEEKTTSVANQENLDSIMPDSNDDEVASVSNLEELDTQTEGQDKQDTDKLDSSLQDDLEKSDLEELNLAEGMPSDLSLEDNELPSSLQGDLEALSDNENPQADDTLSKDSNGLLEKNIAEEVDMSLDSLSQAQPLAQEAQLSDTNEVGLDSSLDSSVETSTDSSQTNLDLSNIPESGISKYLEVSDTTNEEFEQENELQEVSSTQSQTSTPAPSKQNASEPAQSAKITQKRLITELLANKSVEEISSLLEGAHIRIDIDFSQE